MEILCHSLDSSTRDSDVGVAPTTVRRIAIDIIVGNVEAANVTDTVVDIYNLSMVTADVVVPRETESVKCHEVDTEIANAIHTLFGAHSITTFPILIVVGHHTNLATAFGCLFEMLHTQFADTVIGNDQVFDPHLAFGIVDVLEKVHEFVMRIGIDANVACWIGYQSLVSQIAHQRRIGCVLGRHSVT